MPDEGMREILDKLLVDLFWLGATNIALAKRLELIIHFAGFPDTARLSSLMKYMQNRSPSSAQLYQLTAIDHQFMAWFMVWFLVMGSDHDDMIPCRTSHSQTCPDTIYCCPEQTERRNHQRSGTLDTLLLNQDCPPEAGTR
jgi:hypothetical protein